MSPQTRRRSFPRSVPSRHWRRTSMSSSLAEARRLFKNRNESVLTFAHRDRVSGIWQTRMMDGLMDRYIPPQDRLTREDLIVILILSLCLWPVVWELY